ncbi:sugar-binding domain-containing protein [Cryobacterium sp. PH31-AA6]|uniref:sugar-binding transcriptional regulator n=1 Tax=Cryobacterium sp. PH31-AA6 TaxID=3046205 RepID=UPI0024BB946B|nr:sugar-binding domain-containing protein [Cryobacterium sp. PH31-AA6]MDJ0324233.1 sugar-binding domain-containing protein [Cryobacterium sp. PH31-AA6]
MDEEFSRDTLASVARRFYLEDASKVELGIEYGVSRFKIARMLQVARESGVVTIEIHNRDDQRQALAARLALHLGLDDVLVVPNGDSEEADRQRIAFESARYLSRITRPDDTIGVSWGRTIYALTEYLRDLPPCTVVQLTGTVGNDFAQSPMEVLQRIAARHPLSTVGIFAPLFAATPTAAQVLRSETSIADALATYDRLTTAVLAIGSWNPPITQIRSLLAPDELADLDSEHAVAEVVASFLDADGRVIDLPLNQRRIAIEIEQLRATPRVIAAAGSLAKVPAIHAVASSGILTMLVTDEAAALELLLLPKITRHTRLANDSDLEHSA